jgi:hypothetical protein
MEYCTFSTLYSSRVTQGLRIEAIYRDCHVPTVRTGKNEAKDVTFRLSGRAKRAIYATNEAIDTLGHTLTAHEALLKLVTGEAKGHAPKGPKLRSKKYSMRSTYSRVDRGGRPDDRP